jgi:hypothetical protein
LIRRTCSAPDSAINRHLGGQHRDGRQLLALLLGKSAVRHRREPNVGVEADLMAGVAAQHGPAARLRQVADQQARPAIARLGVGAELLDQADQLRMTPIAIARQPHGLPSGTVDG